MIQKSYCVSIKMKAVEERKFIGTVIMLHKISMDLTFKSVDKSNENVLAALSRGAVYYFA